jgi:hypothetical protein
MLKEHLAHRVGGVVDHRAELQPDVAGGEGVADLAGVGHRPGEPVEFRGDEGVAGAYRGQGPVEAGPVAVGAGVRLVQIDVFDGHAELEQDLPVRFEVLFVGGEAGVPDQDPRRHSHARNRNG